MKLRALLVLFTPLMFAQQFEVASVKLSQAGPNDVSGVRTLHGRLDANNVTLKRLILGAYNIGPNQIQGGPDWLDGDRFEVSAKTAEPTEDDALMMKMLQAVLADRFKLVLHRETRTLSAYLLEVAKGGPKLAPPSGGDGKTDDSATNMVRSLTADNTDLDSFARILSRRTEFPVINRTGIPGLFRMKLQWTVETAGAPAPGDLPGLFTAIEQQLGLHLRAQKVPVEMFVIDHAEKPAAN